MPSKILRVVTTLCAIFCFIYTAESAASPASDFGVNVSAKSWILFDPISGKTLAEKNSDLKLPMASTTKIMSTLLCLESGNLDEEFTVDENAILVEGSSMGLLPGDIVTKRSLCHGMLLPSGNDAANATAVKISGSLEDFASLMNKRAAEIGMMDTNFVTPSGLHDEKHYSTAQDMAMLTRVAMKNEDFRSICSLQSASVEFGNLPYRRMLYNTNKLLAKYKYAIGVKTGFTDEAGRCLVSCAEKDGIELICITLNDPDDWNNHIKLYEYGFSRMSNVNLTPKIELSVPIAGGKAESCRLFADDITVGCINGNAPDYNCVLRTPPFVYAPIKEGDELGVLEYYSNGVIIGSSTVYSTENIAKAEPRKFRLPA